MADAPASDVAVVINGTDLVENMANQVILLRLAPRQEARSFCWDVLLDSSVISLGAKIKVCSAVAEEIGFKLDRDALHDVAAYRNAFAHHGLHSHPLVDLRPTEQDSIIHYQLKVLRGNGRVDHMKRDEALAKFNGACDAAKTSLRALIADLKARQPARGS